MTNSGHGFVTRVGKALDTPFSTQMTWLQLGAVIIFISIIALGWRQVILYIGQEI